MGPVPRVSTLEDPVTPSRWSVGVRKVGLTVLSSRDRSAWSRKRVGRADEKRSAVTDGRELVELFFQLVDERRVSEVFFDDD
jgi:hypothetical protein